MFTYFMKRFTKMPYSWIFIILILVAISFFYGGSSLADPFPRHTSLPVFNPHRTSFTCAIEAAVLPPIDPEADEWFYEGMALTSTEKWEEDIDYARAAMLWTKASERGHWKAQYNLAELYINGDGVPQNFEKALLLIEEGMKQGIPSAWDRMGSLYGEGMPGFQSSATLAWAFWQRAADMGSAAAQAYIGSHLDAVDDDPKTLYWANQVIALQMMECAYAQAHGRGAYDLALTYIFADTPRKNEALAALQNGVRWGGGFCSSSMDQFW